MTLAATYTPAKYDCDGSITQFPFQHPFFEVTDLVVYVIDDAGVVDTLDYGSGAGNYTISATNNDFSSGATIITGSTYAEGYRLVIERSVPYGQQLDINGDFVPAEPLEQQLDKLAAQIQQIKEELNRTVVCPVSDSPGLTYEIGSETERAGKALGFDSSGNVTELSIATEGGAFTAVDTNKGLSSSGGTIAGKVDDSTLAFSSGNFAVKAGGIGTTQLADDAVTVAKIASPTGTDTNVVTGTKGTNGNLVKWDANGDAVDSGESPASILADAASAAFGAQSLTTSGYQVFGSGLIVQWGQRVVAADSTATVTVPLAFPNACLQGIASQGQAFSTSTDAGAGFYNFPSGTQATVINGDGGGTGTIRWLAIGY